MTHGQAKHHRRSIRLQGYDYSQPGSYFVTICTQNHECLFGDIVEGEMVLNDAGQMVQAVWDALPRHYPGIGIDMFVIMPNHIHGIITIQPPDTEPPPPTVGAGPCACPADVPARPANASATGHPSPPTGQPQGVAPTKTMALAEVVHRFKTLTTKRYADGVKHHGWKPFPGRLWQRNYWEHVVRNERELHRIREYISTNPAKWELDRLYRPPSESANKVREQTAEYAIEEWMV